ncbi:MAG: CoA transferase [Robiginitomaculum sp.]|nr:MAG: CoA transferase [Robiginitomaculum sp.]
MLKPLSGIKLIEIQGLGPCPFSGYFLAELGAEITLVKRPQKSKKGPPDLMEQGKTILYLDLKSEEDRETLLNLSRSFDGLIEGMRPGVMERLGLGPAEFSRFNPAFVFGRVTGWGQEGPLSHAAGHDLNYIALSGALWYSGDVKTPPLSPPTLVGDIAGGSLYLIIGILSAIIHAQKTGEGQVIDAAMVDGSAHMMNLLLSIPKGAMREERGKSILDGPHWYNSYECQDGKFITIGSLEPQFYKQLLTALELDNNPEFSDQMNYRTWPRLKLQFTDIFKMKTQSEWCDIMEGTDICFAPILSPQDAAQHEHIKFRNIYSKKGEQLKAASAPRFKPISAP